MIANLNHLRRDELPPERGWIQTFTGKKFFPLDPDPESIDIRDIAHGLSQKCRYNGQSKKFYSVAQHSVLASCLVDSREHKLHALLHDAAEAYLCDLPRPLKYLPEFRFYCEIENKLQDTIQAKFGLPSGKPVKVHYADRQMFAHESRHAQIVAPAHPDFDLVDLDPTKAIFFSTWDPEFAENEFMTYFRSFFFAGKLYDTNFIQG